MCNTRDYETIIMDQFIQLAVDRTNSNWNAVTKTLGNYLGTSWRHTSRPSVRETGTERPPFTYSNINWQSYSNVYRSTYLSFYLSIMRKFVPDVVFSTQVNKIADYVLEKRKEYKQGMLATTTYRGTFAAAQLGCKMWLNMLYGRINSKGSVINADVDFKTLVTDIGRSIMSSAMQRIADANLDGRVLIADADEIIATVNVEKYMREAAPGIEVLTESVSKIRFEHPIDGFPTNDPRHRVCEGVEILDRG